MFADETDKESSEEKKDGQTGQKNSKKVIDAFHKYKLSENGDEKTATIPQFHVNWLPGHRYYIHINLGTANVKI